MDNYALVIDISSDEEVNRYGAPIKTLPVNMVGMLSLSDSSVEVWRGSEADLEFWQTSISTFNSEPKEVFVVKRQKGNDSDDCYEEPDSSRDMPELTPAPIRNDITNAGKQEDSPSTKVEKLDDLSEPSVREIENSYGFNLDAGELHCLAGRGNSFTSARMQRLGKQPIQVVREIPHCTGVPASTARGALSRPAPGRCNSCREGIHKFATCLGHGIYNC